MASVFTKVTDHLLNARLNLMGGDQLTARLITTPISYSGLIATAYWLQDLEYYLGTQTAAFTPVCVLASGVMKVSCPDLQFAIQYGETTVYGVVFSKETGNHATSPVVSIDLFDGIVLSPGLTYTYQAPTNGLLRLTTAS